MKPLRLTVEGINSFIEPRTVDFEALSQNGIFCICGPTGSGKTTLLDSVILALYAPSSHHRGNLKEYINTKCEKGKITLDFEADGTRYRVYRELRKNASSAGKLTDLDTGEVLADKADTTTERIKQMLKLDKDDFTKVVVLEQGKYAEFMGMTKARRCETVSKLFGLERYEKLKATLAAAVKKYTAKGNELHAALAQYEGVTEAALSEKKRALTELHKQAEQIKTEAGKWDAALKESEKRRDVAAERTRAQTDLAASVAEEDKLAAEYKALAAQREEDEKRRALLAAYKQESDAAHARKEKANACIADEEEAKTWEAQRNSLRVDYKAADEKYTAAQKFCDELSAQAQRDRAQVRAAQEELAAKGITAEPTEAGFVAVHAKAEADRAQKSAAESKRAVLAKKTAALQTVAETLFAEQNRLQAQLLAARDAEQRAADEYEHARQHNAAALLRGALHEGDACPVCGGTFTGGGSDEQSASVASAKETYEKRAAERKKAEEDDKKNAVEYARYSSDLSQAKEGLRECETILKGGGANEAAEISAWAEKGAAAAKRIAQTERALAETEKEREKQKEARERIADEGRKCGERMEALRKKISERLDGKMPQEVLAEAEKAVAAYERLAEECERAAAAQNAAATALAARESAVREKRKEAERKLAALPSEPFDPIAYAELTRRREETHAALEGLHAAAGSAQAQIEQLQERLEKKKQLTQEKKQVAQTLDNVTVLNKCTERDNKFLLFVAERYVQAFTEAAGDTLSSLTGGKYTLLYDDGEFYVQDFFADNARRKVKTLSGGETFLASMSIAMAISRAIASQNYEFFFLDEGFGTLHERAMETVTAALTELSRDTIVGIVTHRTELADRIASRLTVEPATETEGSNLRFSGM